MLRRLVANSFMCSTNCGATTITYSTAVIASRYSSSALFTKPIITAATSVEADGTA